MGTDDAPPPVGLTCVSGGVDGENMERRVPIPARPRLDCRRATARRRGSALVYVSATFVALIAFASLAVDLSRVYVVRSELQLAADAAARYGVTGLMTSVTAAETCAVDSANDNTADGTAVVINPDADIVFGRWANKKFTPLSGPARSTANAIQVTARRTAASGAAVPLFFARVIGKTSHDVAATSVAYLDDRQPSGIIGFSSILMKNNTFIGSYNSLTNRSPTEATATSVGSLLSNGTITGENNNELLGGIKLGAGAPTASGIDVTGGVSWLDAALVPPPQVAWAPAANPNGIPQDYTANGNVTLPGGDYWFTSLTVDGSLKFSGPATLVVDGPINVSGTLHAFDLIPGNLLIRQRGSNVFGDGDASGMDIVADLVGPGTEFVAKNRLTFRGRMVVGSIDFKNGGDVFYDIALGDSTAGGKQIVTVR